MMQSLPAHPVLPPRRLDSCQIVHPQHSVFDDPPLHHEHGANRIIPWLKHWIFQCHIDGIHEKSEYRDFIGKRGVTSTLPARMRHRPCVASQELADMAASPLPQHSGDVLSPITVAVAVALPADRADGPPGISALPFPDWKHALIRRAS